MAEGNIPPFKVPTTDVPLAGPEELWKSYFDDPEEMQYLVSDLRQRHAAVLMQDGENFLWLKRRLSGTVCPYWSDESGTCSDPLNADAACYNAKYLGGYHAPMILKVGLPSSQKQQLTQEAGILKVQTQRQWTLWTPELVNRDMLVRQTTGERFELVNVQPSGPWRGLIVVQFFETRPMQAGVDYGVNVPITVTGL